ncbi:hypothetical protein ALO56_200182 [Pseudomonas viridiflava]|nr:hypothetical protein ALO56_200182 [Pseudomonas viridiflava]
MFFQSSQRRFAFVTLQTELLQFLTTGQHTALRFAGTSYAQEVSPDPVAVATDQALPRRQLTTPGERLVQVADRDHLPQPGRQVDIAFHLVEQTACHALGIGSSAQQAQIALLEVRHVQPVEIIDQYGLQISAKHRLDRHFPTGVYLEAFRQTRALIQVLIAQPFGGAGVRVEGGLLQGFQRGQSAIEALQLALRLLLVLIGALQGFAQLFKTLDCLLFAHVQFFEGHVPGGEVFAQFQNRRVFRVGSQQLTLFAQTPLALGQPLHALFQLLDARLLNLSLTLRLGGLLIEDVPLFLPAVHGGFGVFQGDGRLFGGRAGHLLLGLKHLQLFAERGQQRGVVPQVRFGFLAGALGFAQVVLQLTQSLLAVLNALLDAGDVAAHRIEAALHQIEAFGEIVMAVAQSFDAGIGTALISDQCFETDFLTTDHGFTLTDLFVQRLPAQRRQLRLELAFFGLVFLILLGRLGLTMQTLELALQFFAQVGQARQVLVGAANAVLGFTAAFLVLGNARSFLDEIAQILGLGFDQFGDHALLDDRVAAWPQASPEKDVGDVTTTAFGAVEVIAVLAIAGHFAANGNFRIGSVFAHQRAVGVVEHQLDAGLTDRLATGRTVEDDVGHRLAAQVLGRAFAHDPAHGVDDVGFSATVGADDSRHVAGEVHRGGVDEGFEPRQLDALQTHGVSLPSMQRAPADNCAGHS